MSTVPRRRFRSVLLVALPVLVVHVLGPASAHAGPAAHGETVFESSCGPLALDAAVATPPAPPAPALAVPATIAGPLRVVADPPVLSVLCRWRI